MNRGAWQATVHGVTKSWTWLRGWATDQLTETHKAGTSSSSLYKWGNGSQRDYIAYPSSHRKQTASGSIGRMASTQWQIGSTFRQVRLQSLVFTCACLFHVCSHSGYLLLQVSLWNPIPQCSPNAKFHGITFSRMLCSSHEKTQFMLRFDLAQLDSIEEKNQSFFFFFLISWHVRCAEKLT